MVARSGGRMPTVSSPPSARSPRPPLTRPKSRNTASPRHRLAPTPPRPDRPAVFCATLSGLFDPASTPNKPLAQEPLAPVSVQVDSALKRATAIAQQCMDEVSRLRDENSQQAHVFDEQLKAKEAVHVLRARALTAECASLEQELVQIREHSKQISNEEQRRHLAALDRQREKLGQAPMLQRQDYERTLSRVRDECSNRVVRLEAERATEVASLKEYAHRSTAQLRAEASNLQLWLVKERREWATAEKQIRDRHNSRMDGLREIHEGQRAMLVKEYEVQLSTFGCSLSQIEAETNLRMANQAASHRATLATLKARLASEDAARCTAMRVSLSEMQTELDH